MVVAPIACRGNMKPKVRLTPLKVKNLKPAAHGKRYEISDSEVPGLIVRVGPLTKRNTFVKTYMVIARHGGSKHPTRLKVGDASKMLLADARAKANKMLALKDEGIHPRIEEARIRQEAAAARAMTFGLVMEDYFKRKVRTLKSGYLVEQTIRVELFPPWENRPITEITRGEAGEVIDAIAFDRGKRTRAHNVLALGRAAFNWVIDRPQYGVTVSPFDRMKASRLIGPHNVRDRVLTNAELRWFWKASGATGVYGLMLRLKLLCGLRRDEVASMTKGEWDPAEALLTISGARTKSGRPHLVPCPPLATEILNSRKPKKRPFFMFSTRDGAKPLSGFSKMKIRLDQAMEEIAGEPIPPWVVHDLRRTCRTRLAALGTPTDVAELILGHQLKGLEATYNRYAFVPERRLALAKWEAELLRIVGAE
jgi:integrase